MDKIKNVDTDKIDVTMVAIASVLKAIVEVVRCVDSFKESKK